MNKPDPSFWRNKRILLTGHTGFKGAWLALWLQRMGAHVSALALAPATTPSLYALADVGSVVDETIGDIRNLQALQAIVASSRPDIVMHLAAQALVRRSYAAPVDTFGTNVMGTVNLLEALRTSPSTRVAVFATTDKVYRNQEWHHPYRESDVLGGHDPYSASKAASELVIDSYRASFLEAQGMAVGSARAGNVIGGGDWSEDRLIPDAIRAWQRGETLSVRSPESTRPWQHVLEPLGAYLRFAEHLWERPGDSGAFNFGPDAAEVASVRTIVERMQDGMDPCPVKWGSGDPSLKEAKLLALDTSRARAMLGIVPRWNVGEAVDRSMNWYRALAQGEAARELCERDIDAFEAGSCG